MDPAELLKQLGIDLVKDADNYEPVEGSYKFKIMASDPTGKGSLLKAYTEKDEETGDEDHYIAGTASSSIKDLHGDTILPTALIDMEKAANNNLTMLLNHDAKVPEDIAGSCIKASIVSNATDPETGAPIYDLNFEKIRVNKSNPRALDTFKALRGDLDKSGKPKGNGVKLGLSIGARIPEGGAIRNKKDGTLLISHLNLLECSIVSIPANPRSWIDYAVKSYKTGPDGAPDASTGPGVRLELEVPETGSTSATVTASVVPTPPAEPEPITPEPVAAAAEPDVTASQGAPQSEPGADASAVAAAATPDPEPVPEGMLRSLVEAQSALGEITTKYIAAEQARIQESAKAARLEGELESLKVFTRDFVGDTNQLLARLSRLPVGQKASFKAIATDFDSSLKGLEDVYGANIIATLSRSTDT